MEITAEDLKARMADGARVTLVDVREPWEWDLCRLEGARHIPMGEIPVRYLELDPEEDVVVYCHVGQRSAMVVEYLRKTKPPSPYPRLGSLLGARPRGGSIHTARASGTACSRRPSGFSGPGAGAGRSWRGRTWRRNDAGGAAPAELRAGAASKVPRAARGASGQGRAWGRCSGEWRGDIGGLCLAPVSDIADAFRACSLEPPPSSSRTSCTVPPTGRVPS